MTHHTQTYDNPSFFDWSPIVYSHFFLPALCLKPSQIVTFIPIDNTIAWTYQCTHFKLCLPLVNDFSQIKLVTNCSFKLQHEYMDAIYYTNKTGFWKSISLPKYLKTCLLEIHFDPTAINYFHFLSIDWEKIWAESLFIFSFDTMHPKKTHTLLSREPFL